MRKGLKFEVHLVEHCNLNCKGCFHFSNIAEPEFLKLEDYEKDIQRLSKLYEGKLELGLLLGGEPLLHKNLNKFMEITRLAFPEGKIGLVTNGLLLHLMPDEFWNVCSEYKITLMPTVYPVNIDWDEIEEKALEKNVSIDYFNDKNKEKTLSVLSIDCYGEQDAIKNFSECYRANFCITLKDGKLYTCLLPAHLHHFFSKYELSNCDFSEDGIDIYKVDSAEEIEELLKKPIGACAYCNREKWRDGNKWERSKGKMEEWI